MSEWIDVRDDMPKREGTYLVKTSIAQGPRFIVHYYGRNRIVDNVAFSTIKFNYKRPWSIERGPGDWARLGGRVTHWAYLPGEDKNNED